MAVATIRNGVITGVTLTCPGQGYLPGDVLSFDFGGEGSATAGGSFPYTLRPGDVAANGTGGVTKLGDGTLILSGSNTYTGGTTVQQGMLQLGNASALGAGGLAVNGGTLDLNGFSVTVPSFSGAGGAR